MMKNVTDTQHISSTSRPPKLFLVPQVARRRPLRPVKGLNLVMRMRYPSHSHRWYVRRTSSCLMPLRCTEYGIFNMDMGCLNRRHSLPLRLQQESELDRTHPPKGRELTVIVDDVLDAHRVAMRIQSSGPSSRTGLVTRTTNHVRRTLKSAGAINAGAIKGIIAVTKLS